MCVREIFDLVFRATRVFLTIFVKKQEKTKSVQKQEKLQVTPPDDPPRLSQLKAGLGLLKSLPGLQRQAIGWVMQDLPSGDPEKVLKISIDKIFKFSLGYNWLQY